MRIAIVGICASGKTTLVRGLREAGYDAYNVAQEHSCIHDFWNKHHPDVLVMIDATLAAADQRRVVTWGRDRSDTQHEWLAHARKHADLYIQTDHLDAEAVKNKVINFLKTKEVKI